MVTGKFGKMWLSEEGILMCIYAPDIIIDLKLTYEILECRLKLLNGYSCPHFFDTRGVKYWTPESRAFMATDENSQLQKAAAALINSYITRVWINFWFSFNKPKIPLKIFTDREEALNWLKEYK